MERNNWIVLKYIELFAGIGGFRLGLEKANRSKRIWDKPISEQGRDCDGNRRELLQGTRNEGQQDEGSGRGAEKVSKSIGIQQRQRGETDLSRTEGKHIRNSKRSEWQPDTIPTRDRNILQKKTPKGIQKTMPSIKERKAGFTCVYANEWDKYACQIYRKNFGKRMFDKDSEICQTTTEVRNKKKQSGKQFNRYTERQYDCPELHEGDITKVSAESIPDHDLLTAGFPCPTYSIAGKRKGFEDPRGIVFFEICRIAKVKKPALLLLENVKGLLNHQGGETFRIILDSLSELGYDCEWEVFNSAYYSVPQHRERVYIIGHLRGTGGQKIFPLGKTTRKGDESNKRQTTGCVKGASGHIQNDETYIIYWKNSKEKWVKENRTCTTAIKTQSDLCRRPLIERLIKIGNVDTKGHNSLWGRVYDPEGTSCNINAKGGGLGAKTGLYKVDYIQNPKLRSYKKQEIAGSLTESQYKEPQVVNGIRRLTPTECERLQGFPDGWTEGISDTQRYKCLGNAVTVNVVEEIGKKLN